jgi:hypothetical protein
VGQHGAGGGLAAGIADLSRPIANDKDDFVAKLLKLSQLAKPDYMAQVDIGAAGVEAHLQPQRLALLQQPHHFLFHNNFSDASPEDFM